MRNSKTLQDGPLGKRWVRDITHAQVETLDHLLTGCVFNRETWFRILRCFQLDGLAPQAEQPFAEWWTDTRKQVAKVRRKGFDSIVWLVAWLIWRERNRRVHQRSALQPVALAPVIMEEARLWARAGFVALASLLGIRLF
ncbi:hypothetical protein SETIT_3G144200v2 [Setaria italica]|uniref:Uncharacterized protein n=1 Tax=Setaria italica TaxID=4555 RepID=A0A368QGW1_SETIT|nr:hypothetical protein SETIT_3G144200v2 [Setaria italica]